MLFVMLVKSHKASLHEENSIQSRFTMYNYPRSNSPFGGGNRGLFGSPRYQYQAMPQGYEGVQAGSLISKVMVLLAFSFLFAFIGTFAGFAIGLTFSGYWIVAIGGLIVLFSLNFSINKPRWNLFLLFLFTFFEGIALSPLLNLFLCACYGIILGENLFFTAIT